MTDVVVIGAGQAGLSSAYFLRRAGFEPGTGYVVLDGDRAPGGAWQHRWPSLHMATVNGIFDLPGMAFEPPSPQERASVAVPRYFADFEERFQLAVHRPATVRAVRYGPEDRLLVEANGTGTGRHRDVGGTRRDQRHGDVEQAFLAVLPRPGDVPRTAAARGHLSRSRGVRRQARDRCRRRDHGDPAAHRARRRPVLPRRG